MNNKKNLKRLRKSKNLHPVSLKSKILTAQDLFQEFGLKKFSTKIMPFMFYRKYIFCSQLINSIVSIPSCDIPFRLELSGETDIQHLMRLRPGYYPFSLLQRRLKEGHLCFLGWSGNLPIHVRWVFIRSLYLPYLHRTYVLSPREVYADDAYTIPPFRRKGIYTYAGYLLRMKLQNLGYERFTCTFASWNSGPLRLADKIGLQKVGEGGYWNMFGYKKFFWKGSVRNDNDGKISIRESK